MSGKKSSEVLRHEILDLVKEYHDSALEPKTEFLAGESRIPYAGRVFDSHELINLVDSSLDFWLTNGRYSERFEESFASFLGVRHCLLVNSGSSANLLAFMALTSDLLGARKIQRGDEVITVAAGFPTTVAPIIQYGATPVFVDVELETANIDVSLLEGAVSQRTKAVMLAHTLGNPFNLESVGAFCRQHNLWLIEDNCDALGSRYATGLTGTFGDIGTSSFYPPHHMTMGEGGAVYTNDGLLAKVLLSMRDWGRECKCPSGVDNLCGHRFEHNYSALPSGYDHKYVYSHFGYNLKATDMQAAIGCAQLEKVPAFIAARRRNWDILRCGLVGMEDVYVLPRATLNSEPSWFGFLLVVREEATFTRDQIIAHLEAAGIQTRMLFAGNIINHPCFDTMRGDVRGYRVAGGLPNTNTLMHCAFWVGVYPGMTDEMLEFIIDQISGFCKN